MILKDRLFFVIGLLFVFVSSAYSSDNLQVPVNSDFRIYSDHAFMNEEMVPSIEFKVDAPVSGKYRPVFWASFPVVENGQMFYEVDVNGGEDTYVIEPLKDGWHYVSLRNGEEMYLEKGVNTITIKGIDCILPAVEHIDLFGETEYSKHISDNYEEYINKIENNSFDDYDMAKAEKLDSNQQEFPHDYSYALGIKAEYSFTTSFYFSAGNVVSIKANGSNAYETYVIQLFEGNNNYYQNSVISKSADGVNPVLRVVIPKGGFYTVRVRPYLLNKSYVANLNVSVADNSNSLNAKQYKYAKVPVSSNGVHIDQITYESLIDFMSSTYNTFTCNSTGDPELWLERGSYNTSESSFRNLVIDYNDNAEPTDDFDWGSNSRICKLYNDYNKIPTDVFVTSKKSSEPIINCDLYLLCSTYEDWGIPFYEIPSDNVMVVSAHTELQLEDGVYYNCISWTGGITDEGVWPPTDPRYNINPSTGLKCSDLESFDNYYRNERYPGCARFVRSGANASNSVINLWYNNDDYQHASIKTGADKNPHGFAWESKLGYDYPRVFHPESKMLKQYGSIKERYRILQPATNNTLTEAVANGDVRIEYVSYNDREKKQIDTNVDLISLEVKSKFESLLNDWRTVWRKTVMANPMIIKNCSEFRALLSFMHDYPETRNILYKELPNSNLEIIVILQEFFGDTFYKSVSRLSENSKATTPGIAIYETQKGLMMKYVKSLLPNINECTRNEDDFDDISYSNGVDMKLKSFAGNIDVFFCVQKSENNIFAYICNERGDVIEKSANPFKGSDNNYRFSFANLKDGIYFVCLYVDGKLNAKKVTVSHQN